MAISFADAKVQHFSFITSIKTLGKGINKNMLCKYL